MFDEGIKEQKIILLDGVCNLYNRSAVFSLKNHEKDSSFHLCSINGLGNRTSVWSQLKIYKVRFL